MSPRCHFCGEPCTDDDYCRGCYCHVCDKCDLPPDDAPIGEHEVGDHRPKLAEN